MLARTRRLRRVSLVPLWLIGAVPELAASGLFFLPDDGSRRIHLAVTNEERLNGAFRTRPLPSPPVGVERASSRRSR